MKGFMRSAGEQGKDTLAHGKDNAGDLGTFLVVSTTDQSIDWLLVVSIFLSSAISVFLISSSGCGDFVLLDLFSQSSFDFPDNFRCNFSAVCLMNDETLLLEMVKVTFDVAGVIGLMQGCCAMLIVSALDVLGFKSDVLLVMTATRQGMEVHGVEVFVSNLARSTGGFGGGPLGLLGGSGGGPLSDCCCCCCGWDVCLRRGGFSTNVSCVLGWSAKPLVSACCPFGSGAAPAKIKSARIGGDGLGLRLMDNVVVAMRGGTGGGTFFGTRHVDDDAQ